MIAGSVTEVDVKPEITFTSASDNLYSNWTGVGVDVNVNFFTSSILDIILSISATVFWFGSVGGFDFVLLKFYLI